MKREREPVGVGQRERQIKDTTWALFWQQRAQCEAQTYKPQDHDLRWSRMPNAVSAPDNPKFSLTK